MAKRESNKITKRQRKVALALTVSENLSSQEKGNSVLGYRSGEMAAITASPQVVRAVKAGLVRRLVGEAAPRSIDLLMRMVEKGHTQLDAGDAATAVQVDAAKSLLGMTGLQAIAEEKDYGDMSDTEFRQVLERVQDELAKRTSVDAEGTVNAPDNAPVPSEDTELIDSLFS